MAVSFCIQQKYVYLQWITSVFRKGKNCLYITMSIATYLLVIGYMMQHFLLHSATFFSLTDWLSIKSKNIKQKLQHNSPHFHPNDMEINPLTNNKMQHKLTPLLWRGRERLYYLCNI